MSARTLKMVERALERGHLRAGWVAGDDAFGMSPSFREGLAALGMRYVLDVPGGTTVFLGHLPPEPGRQRAPLLPVQRSRGYSPGDPGNVGGSRWRIETEFETEKSDVGLDEYETRTWAGWHHHVALCLLGGAFLLSLQQAWGEKDAPDHETAGLPGGAGDAAPGTVRAG